MIPLFLRISNFESSSKKQKGQDSIPWLMFSFGVAEGLLSDCLIFERDIGLIPCISRTCRRQLFFVANVFLQMGQAAELGKNVVRN